MKKHSFYIAGGDKRLCYLANALGADGYSVKAYGLPEGLDEGVAVSRDIGEAASCDTVILPLPCQDGDKKIRAEKQEEKIPLLRLIERLRGGTAIIGGIVPEEIKEVAKKRNIAVYDYYDREEFTVRNASLTAEAAVALALDALKESINNMPVLILGHGRIGRLLAAMLKALDAKVTVAARRFSDLAWIRSEGAKPLEFSRLGGEIEKYGLIFNTVPAMVLDEDMLEKADKNVLIIDLASEPGGTDFEAAKRLGITAKKALGLPGKFAPKTAGEILHDTVLNILSESEE